MVVDVAVADQDHLDILGPCAQKPQTVDEFFPAPTKTGTGVEQPQAVAAEHVHVRRSHRERRMHGEADDMVGDFDWWHEDSRNRIEHRARLPDAP